MATKYFGKALLYGYFAGSGRVIHCIVMHGVYNYVSFKLKCKLLGPENKQVLVYVSLQLAIGL